MKRVEREFTEPTPSAPLYRNLTTHWSTECLEKCGGNIVLYLTKLHPSRTYHECQVVMNNEGYMINEEGFLEPVDPKQVARLVDEGIL